MKSAHHTVYFYTKDTKQCIVIARYNRATVEVPPFVMWMECGLTLELLHSWLMNSATQIFQQCTPGLLPTETGSLRTQAFNRRNICVLLDMLLIDNKSNKLLYFI